MLKPKAATKRYIFIYVQYFERTDSSVVIKKLFKVLDFDQNKLILCFVFQNSSTKKGLAFSTKPFVCLFHAFEDPCNLKSFFIYILVRILKRIYCITCIPMHPDVFKREILLSSASSFFSFLEFR